MTFLSRRCMHLFGAALIALMLPTFVTPTGANEVGPINFPHENRSDLRGVSNVFEAFKQACLVEPASREIADTLLPQGYHLVSADKHGLGWETPASKGAVVLSRTGDEHGDFAEGDPFIELRFPTDSAPFGACRVTWQRKWDYPDGVQTVMTGVAALLDGWLSYSLKAVRISRPEDYFAPEENYSAVSNWAAPCFDGRWCGFDLLFEMRKDEGIHLTIKREEIPKGSGTAD